MPKKYPFGVFSRSVSRTPSSRAARTTPKPVCDSGNMSINDVPCFWQSPMMHVAYHSPCAILAASFCATSICAYSMFFSRNGGTDPR